MRLIAILLVLGACHDDDRGDTCSFQGRTYQQGDAWVLDDCNDCFCYANGVVMCIQVACFADAGPAVCFPSMGCAVGPACDDFCCDSGEACVDGECRCGTIAGCDPGDSCVPFGTNDVNGCGSICCGASGPCP